MEHVDELTAAETAAPAEPLCAGCQAPLAQPLPRTPVCPSCREQFIRYPIPFWIKAFGAGVLLVVCFCLYTFPKNLQTGIHFKRGVAAAEARNYRTAQKEFGEALQREPGFLEAQCRLLVAAFHNDDFTTVAGLSAQLEGKNIEDGELFSEVSGAVNTMNSYFPTDSFTAFAAGFAQPEDSIPAEAYRGYLARYPGDAYATLRLAGIYLDHDDYAAADQLINPLLESHPDLHPAVAVKISAKRDLLQFDSAYYYADRLLAANHEYVYALSSKARVLLKEKKGRQALDLAKQGHSMDAADGHATATLALAYHFNRDTKSRDALLAKASGDTANAYYINIAKDIISGKEPFRD